MNDLATLKSEITTLRTQLTLLENELRQMRRAYDERLDYVERTIETIKKERQNG